MVFLNEDGSMKDYTDTKLLTATASSMTTEDEINHCEEAIRKYTETFMFTTWWSIFEIRHTQRMIRSYQKRIEELKAS